MCSLVNRLLRLNFTSFKLCTADCCSPPGRHPWSAHTLESWNTAWVQSPLSNPTISLRTVHSYSRGSNCRLHRKANSSLLFSSLAWRCSTRRVLVNCRLSFRARVHWSHLWESYWKTNMTKHSQRPSNISSKKPTTILSFNRTLTLWEAQWLSYHQPP